MNDLISRQAAIDEAKEWIDAVYFEENDKRERKAIECLIGSLKNMPSAQPGKSEDAVSREEAKWVVFCNRDHVEDQVNAIDGLPLVRSSAQQWTPCSERPPEEEEYVLISKKPTKISGDKWCVTIAIRMTDPRSRKIQWRDSGFGIIQDDKVLAWMPLPEPYKGGGHEQIH